MIRLEYKELVNQKRKLSTNSKSNRFLWNFNHGADIVRTDSSYYHPSLTLAPQR